MYSKQWMLLCQRMHADGRRYRSVHKQRVRLFVSRQHIELRQYLPPDDCLLQQRSMLDGQRLRNSNLHQQYLRAA
jgi:hypothetical protein